MFETLLALYNNQIYHSFVVFNTPYNKTHPQIMKQRKEKLNKQTENTQKE